MNTTKRSKYDVMYRGNRIDVKSTPIDEQTSKYDSYLINYDDAHKSTIDTFVCSWVAQSSLTVDTESIKVRYVGWVKRSDVLKCRTRMARTMVYMVPRSMLRPIRELIEGKVTV